MCHSQGTRQDSMFLKVVHTAEDAHTKTIIINSCFFSRIYEGSRKPAVVNDL